MKSRFADTPIYLCLHEDYFNSDASLSGSCGCALEEESSLWCVGGEVGPAQEFGYI